MKQAKRDVIKLGSLMMAAAGLVGYLSQPLLAVDSYQSDENDQVVISEVFEDGEIFDWCVEGTIGSLIVEPQPETAYCSTETARKAKPKPDMAKYALLKEAVYNAARTNPALLDDLLKQAQQYEPPERLPLLVKDEQGYASGAAGKAGVQKAVMPNMTRVEITEPEVFEPAGKQSNSGNQSKNEPDNMYDLAPLIKLGSR